MFKKKKQNQYKSTVRKKQGREKNKKNVLRIVLLTLIGIVLAGLLSLGCVYGYKLLTSSAYFDIEEISVSGNSIYSENEIVEISGLRKQQNIFLANLAVSRKNLLFQPWIEDTVVARVLPKKITIDITEYEPLAILEAAEKRYLMDTNGVLFKEWVPTDPAKLPIVQGLLLSDFKVEEPSKKAQTVLYFLTVGQQRGAILPNHAIQKISVDPSGNLTVFPTQGVGKIRLGKNEFEAKLKRIYEILPQLKKERDISEYYTIDATNMDKITLRQKP